MRRQGMTINDAAHEWVREFNAIPQDMIATLMDNDPDSWRELTVKRYGDRVYCYDHNEYGEIEGYDEETELDDADVMAEAEGEDDDA